MDWTLLSSVSIASLKSECQIQNSTGNPYLPRRFRIPRFAKTLAGTGCECRNRAAGGNHHGESIMIDLPSA
jgi:hypothetical protein